MYIIHITYTTVAISTVMIGLLAYCIVWLFQHPSLGTSIVASAILLGTGLTIYWIYEAAELVLHRRGENKAQIDRGSVPKKAFQTKPRG